MAVVTEAFGEGLAFGVADDDAVVNGAGALFPVGETGAVGIGSDVIACLQRCARF
jgi:hypothetical protein